MLNSKCESRHLLVYFRSRPKNGILVTCNYKLFILSLPGIVHVYTPKPTLVVHVHSKIKHYFLYENPPTPRVKGSFQNIPLILYCSFLFPCQVLSLATQDSDNPDLRDRGYIYWRLLSTDPVAAKEVGIG